MHVRLAPSLNASDGILPFFWKSVAIWLAIAAEPDLRLRDIADRVGITERAAQRIVGELEEAGYLEIRREGRRNSYRVQRNRHLRHPAEQHHRIGELIEVLAHRS